jgi:uncharacterized protein (TIGR02646 family)
MIKLQREPEPQKLIDNKSAWLKALREAIVHYGGYNKIPTQEKKRLIAHYRDEKIKEPLLKSSHEKCAFCECIPGESGYPEVEHFKPKSLYPDEMFDWENLLPSCKRCNNNKHEHDTGREPLINPYDINPEEAFYYEDINIKAKNGKYYTEAKRTIDVCGLNASRLLRPRASILEDLTYFEKDIEAALSNYSSHDGSDKTTIISGLKRAIDRIESLSKPEERYSGFCSYFLKTNAVYQRVIALLDQSA